MQGQNIFFGEFIGLGTVGAIHIRVSGHASFHPATISLRESNAAASSARVRMTTGPKSVKRIASLTSKALEMWILSLVSR